MIGGQNRAVRFNADNALVTATDQATKVWDLGSFGGEVASLDHGGTVDTVAYGPEGVIATVGQDGLVKLWDAGTGEGGAVLDAGHGTVNAVGFDRSGDRVVLGHADGTTSLWATADGAAIATLAGPQDFISGVALSPDGQLVAASSGDGAVTVWEASSGAVVTTLGEGAVGEGWLEGPIVFGADGSLLATVTSDGMVRLWDPRSGEQRRDLPHTDSWVTGVGFDAGRSRFVTVTLEGIVRYWDGATGDGLGSVTLDNGPIPVLDVTISPDGLLLSAVDERDAVTLWDGRDGTRIVTVDGYGDSYRATSSDRRSLASVADDGTVVIRHLLTTPQDACELVAAEVTRAELVLALRGTAVEACTTLE
jgi:WD40 repeat protein